MLFNSNRKIQCTRERIREDGKYIHRERERERKREKTHTRITMKERENMRQLLFFSDDIPASYLIENIN